MEKRPIPACLPENFAEALLACKSLSPNSTNCDGVALRLDEPRTWSANFTVTGPDCPLPSNENCVRAKAQFQRATAGYGRVKTISPIQIFLPSGTLVKWQVRYQPRTADVMDAQISSSGEASGDESDASEPPLGNKEGALMRTLEKERTPRLNRNNATKALGKPSNKTRKDVIRAHDARKDSMSTGLKTVSPPRLTRTKDAEVSRSRTFFNSEYIARIRSGEKPPKSRNGLFAWLRINAKRCSRQVIDACSGRRVDDVEFVRGTHESDSSETQQRDDTYRAPVKKNGDEKRQEYNECPFDYSSLETKLLLKRLPDDPHLLAALKEVTTCRSMFDNGDSFTKVVVQKKKRRLHELALIERHGLAKYRKQLPQIFDELVERMGIPAERIPFLSIPYSNYEDYSVNFKDEKPFHVYCSH